MAYKKVPIRVFESSTAGEEPPQPMLEHGSWFLNIPDKKLFIPVFNSVTRKLDPFDVLNAATTQSGGFLSNRSGSLLQGSTTFLSSSFSSPILLEPVNVFVTKDLKPIDIDWEAVQSGDEYDIKITSSEAISNVKISVLC